MKEPTVKELRADIADAFPAITLHPATFTAGKLWSAYPNDRSFEQATDGRAWNELSQEVVEAHAAALGYMNPDAFVAVLPAYLLVLEDTEKELPVFVLDKLTRKDDFRDAFDARVARMTAPQRLVVARVLERLSNNRRFAEHYSPELEAAIATWSAIVPR